MKEFKVQNYNSGVQNKIPAETIAPDAAQDSLGWITEDGRVQLCGGRAQLGADGILGGVFGEIFAPTKNGNSVHFRKISTKIQYFNGTSWIDTITGLTANSDYTFSPYLSLAGAYLFATGPDGLYKIPTANPSSYKDMFDEDKNHKGFSIVNDQRMFLWNRTDGTPDATAIYLSKIDPQGTNYTTVTNEVVGTGNGSQTVFSGTLAQATGKRFVFGISLNMNPSGITATDNFEGVISGTGVTGTINYATGAWTLTFTAAVANLTQIRMSYQYEDSNVNGITDFTFSTTRLAGEGDIIPQEYLGEPIQNILVFEGKYYSMKKTCVYELDLTIDDRNATNNVYRVDIGIPSLRSAVSTGKGIVYLDTANPSKPFLSILQRNPVGGNLEPINLTPLFKWENYNPENCVIDTYGEYIVISLKYLDSDNNDVMFLVNVNQKYSVDIIPYGVNTFAKNEGILYGGDSFSDTVYSIFTGFDDLTFTIDNQWTSKAEMYQSENLKRFRFLRFKGVIDPQQVVEVHASFDGGDFQWLGTIRGDASYVDYNNPEVIGGDEIGNVIGGNGSAVGYPFLMQMRVRVPKFRTRTFKFIAKEIGYVGIEWQLDQDIMVYEQKIPARFRQKQHVNLAGTETNLPSFAD